MTTSMKGKAIVITGAFGTLGACAARAFAAAGGRVALIDRTAQAPPGLLADCGADVVERAPVDLTLAADASAAIDAIHDQIGDLHVLINIAGAFRWQTVAEGNAETWDLLYAINLKTAVNASRAALAHMSKGGRIINIGAAAALKAQRGMGPYAASKSGVHRFTESLADELKATGTTVNAVLPSVIDTPANRADMPDADYSQWVTPNDVAKAILFLASDDAQAITGALLTVPGKL